MSANNGCDQDFPELPAPSSRAAKCPGFVAGCGNFAIQYNYTSASIASAFMLSHRDVTGEQVHPDYPEPAWAKEFLHSAVFVGSVLGMLVMGYLGDAIGIRRALIATNSLVVLGALGSAFLSWGAPSTVWLVITVSRFVLGVGAGGNYPLSAAKASEAAPAHELVAKAGSAFFWQCPGALAPYLLGLFLLTLPRGSKVTSEQFRTLYAVGAVPSLVVLYASAREPHDHVSENGGRGSTSVASTELPWWAHKHWVTLVGTGGSWFLFDVAFYGTVIFTPIILGHVFGAQQTLRDLALRSVFMGIVGTLGTLTGLAALKYVSPAKLNTLGMFLASCLFAVFMGVHHLFPHQRLLQFLLLCMLFFILYAGPNVATYVLPVVSFPRNVRSTFHGLSAAMAKIGAMLGALLFPIMDAQLGVPAVMITQSLICLAGAFLSWCFLFDQEIMPELVAQDGPGSTGIQTQRSQVSGEEDSAKQAGTVIGKPRSWPRSGPRGWNKMTEYEMHC